MWLLKKRYKRKDWFVNGLVMYVNEMTGNVEKETKVNLNDNMKGSEFRETQMG